MINFKPTFWLLAGSMVALLAVFIYAICPDALAPGSQTITEFREEPEQKQETVSPPADSTPDGSWGAFRVLESRRQLVIKTETPVNRAETVERSSIRQEPEFKSNSASHPGSVLTQMPEIKYLNKKTDNLNVLFIGLDGDLLQMVSVYSINFRGRMQSGAVFFPLYALAPGKTVSLQDFYKESDPDSLQNLIEKALDIQIKYYVVIQRAVMDEVREIIGPIQVDGQEIDFNDLFTMSVGPQDQVILGEMMRRFTKPDIYFLKLPRLVLATHRYVKTDFPLTPENLWLHYKIASQIQTDNIKKVILPGNSRRLGAKLAWQLSEPALKRVVYDITR